MVRAIFDSLFEIFEYSRTPNLCAPSFIFLLSGPRKSSSSNCAQFVVALYSCKYDIQLFFSSWKLIYFSIQKFWSKKVLDRSPVLPAAFSSFNVLSTRYACHISNLCSYVYTTCIHVNLYWWQCSDVNCKKKKKNFLMPVQIILRIVKQILCR